MNHTIITGDGSKTLFSSQYNQNFHDEKTGALKESLTKHVIPAINFHKKQKNLKKLKILDICFGIGYNTLATIYYILENDLDIKLEIYSPELDSQLITSLKDFDYPKEFENIKHIITSISNNQNYEDANIKIEVALTNARDYIKNLNNIDIVYQDAFSSDVNKELWTVEYFKELYKACNENTIVTTYSVATPIRLSMHEAGFEIYEIKPVKNKQTIAFKQKQTIEAKYIDMELKQINNKEAKAIYD